VPYLLRGISDDNGICLDFLTEAVARFSNDEGPELKQALVNAMVEISDQLSKMTMNDAYQPHLQALVVYSKFKPLVEALSQSPRFQMAQSAQNIERNTLLGPFFRISPLQAEVATSFFADPRTMDSVRIGNAQSAAQMTLHSHQETLWNIAMAFARAGDAPRNKLLDWFAYIMNVNHKRRAMQVSHRDVASDGFMMNVTAVLDRMCEPFLENSFARMERIDIDYFRRQPRIDITDETKLNADEKESEAFYAEKAGGESKFVSELFFINLASHHYGSGGAVQRLKDINRELKHFEKQLEALHDQRRKIASGPANPAMLAIVDRNVQQYTTAFERSLAYKHSLEAVLLDERMQGRSLRFIRHVAVWLLRLASQSAYTPGKELDIPLPEEQPKAFSCLPEYALQIVLDSFKFLSRNMPKILLSAVGEEIVTLCVTFLESSTYIRNPYLKSALVTVLYSGTIKLDRDRQFSVFGNTLIGSDFANKYLLHALMKFYIECETTGRDSQFFDKFNIRYEIFQVIKHIWSNPIYKEQLREQSK